MVHPAQQPPLSTHNNITNKQTNNSPPLPPDLPLFPHPPFELLPKQPNFGIDMMGVGGVGMNGGATGVGACIQWYIVGSVEVGSSLIGGWCT